jgi:hypothetical protein
LRPIRWRRSVTTLVAVAALVIPACADEGSAVDGTRAKDIEQLPADLIPSELLGLQTKQEDIKSALASTKRAYLDSVGLYSFRREELLQATLQVSRFNDDADFERAGFRQAVVSQIGGSVPKRVRVGKDTVYLTTGTKQTLAMWYRGRNLLVLAVREDFGQPRTLLREALRIRL